MRAAADGLGDLVRDHPHDPDHLEYVKELGRANDNLGAALLRAGQADAAETALRAAVRRTGELADQYRTVPEYRFALALAHDNLAHVIKTGKGLRAAEPERKR